MDRVAHHFGFLAMMSSSFNRFSPDSAKSKIDKFSKITNWVKLQIQ